MLIVLHESSRPSPRFVDFCVKLALVAVLTVIVGLGLLQFTGSATGTGVHSSAETQVLAAQVITPESDVAPTAPSAIEELSATDVAELANPSVVTITSVQELSAQIGQGDSAGLLRVGTGTGFILDEEGHIITNSHVVAGAADITVTFFDGTDVEAALLGHDPFQDVAVLQLDLRGGIEVPGISVRGDSDDVEVGEEILAIGTALGEYANTVTTGNVRGVDRALDISYDYKLSHLIQHTAQLWSGNSGGPMLNLKGEVIGMNVAVATVVGRGVTRDPMSFAIEINAVMDIAEQIIDNGAVARPFLGIESQVRRRGQEVTALVEGGPAATTGVNVGDVITAIDDQSINRDNPFLNLLFEYDPGDSVTLTIFRNDSEESIHVVLGERPSENE